MDKDEPSNFEIIFGKTGIYWGGLVRIFVIPVLVFVWIVVIWNYHFLWGIVGVIVSLILSIIFVVKLDRYLKKRNQNRKQKLEEEKRQLEMQCLGYDSKNEIINK